MAKNPPKSSIPEPLLSAMAEYCRGNAGNTIALVTKVLGANHPSGRATVDVSNVAIAAYEAVKHGKAKLTTSPSPHSPTAKVKRDYWVRVVSSIDGSDMSAYGIKGKLINPEDAESLPENTLLVAMTKHGKKRSVYIVRSKVGKPTNLPYPPTSPNAPLVISGSVVAKYDDPNEVVWGTIFKALMLWKAKVVL